MAQIIITGNDRKKQICKIDIYCEIDFNNNALGRENKINHLQQRLESLLSNELELPVLITESSLKDELFNSENL